MSAQSHYAKLMAAQGQKSEPPPALTLDPPHTPPPTNPVLLYCGATDYKNIGRSKNPPPSDTPHLPSPHRLVANLANVKITYVATGHSSAHCVVLADSGAAFAWGRNEDGQLGLGDTLDRYGPTPVKALEKKTCLRAATGKQHTLFVTSSGELLASGSSKQGCVGPAAGKKGAMVEPTPLEIKGLGEVAAVACGSNFNLVLDRAGATYAFGWGEFGVLGNGTDGEHNTKEGSVKLSYAVQSTPTKIRSLVGKRMVDVACGASHCAAVESDGTCYTWGCGGYGRLGHRDQKDKHVPTPLQEIRVRSVVCGAINTSALGWPVMRNGAVASAGRPSLYSWGRVKGPTQNAWMYPQTEDDLRGWSIHAISSGHVHTFVSADDSVISWGVGTSSGELGFGVNGAKSSARPKKVDSLEGVKVTQVACGYAHTLLLAEAQAVTDKFPEWKPKAGAAPASTKRAAGAAASGAKAKKGKK